MGIATAISEILSAFQLEQPKAVTIDDANQFAGGMSEKQLQFSESTAELSARMAVAPVAESDLDDSSVNFETYEVIEFQNFANEEAIPMSSTSSSDLFLPLIIITVILGGLTIFYLVKYFKK